MTREEMIKDSEKFRGKEGYGYIHCELEDKTNCAIMVAGDRRAIEVIIHQLICNVADSSGMPVELLLTKLLLLHKLDKETSGGDDDKLVIE